MLEHWHDARGSTDLVSGAVAQPESPASAQESLATAHEGPQGPSATASSQDTPRPSDVAEKQPPPDEPDQATQHDPALQGMTAADWKSLPLRFVKVYIVIFIMWLGLLSVYWGALFRREDRVANMRILVAIDDQPFTLENGTAAAPLVGEQFAYLVSQYPDLGRFEIWNRSEATAVAAAHNTTVLLVLERKVHHQEVWAGILVPANMLATVYAQMAGANTSVPYITAVYETGRHYLALSQYVSKNLRTLALAWALVNGPRAYADIIEQQLNSTEVQALVEAAAALLGGLALLAVPQFQFIDNRPAPSSAVLGPSELGLIYAQIFSFHQFNFLADLHNLIRERLRFRHYIWYRILFSQVNFVVLSLVYGLMTLAFKVPTTTAFGHLGFLVLWVTMYMFIAASGGLNECAGTIINFYDVKYLLPPWIIINIVANIAPTFAPFVLSPGFYRYGYTMPMFNAYEALKVVFFNTWKGTLGRNYAVLAAWIVASNLLLVWILLFISRKMRQRMLAEKAKRDEKLPEGDMDEGVSPGPFGDKSPVDRTEDDEIELARDGPFHAEKHEASMPSASQRG